MPLQVASPRPNAPSQRSAPSIEDLYHKVLARGGRSADATLEDIRHAITAGRLAHPAPIGPSTLQTIDGIDLGRANGYFLELRSDGFIEVGLKGFSFFDTTRTAIITASDAIAPIEAVAAVRTQYVNCEDLVAALARMANDITGDALDACIAYHRFCLSLIAAVGTVALLLEYATAARLSLCYLYALGRPSSFAGDLRDRAIHLLTLMGIDDGAGAARAMVDIRCYLATPA